MSDTANEPCDLRHSLPEGEREFVRGAPGLTRAPDGPTLGKARQGGRRTPLPAGRVGVIPSRPSSARSVEGVSSALR